MLPFADRVAVDRVRHEEKLGIIHGDRPEAFGWRHVALRARAAGSVASRVAGPSVSFDLRSYVVTILLVNNPVAQPAIPAGRSHPCQKKIVRRVVNYTIGL
jgi:hypothetical protein